MGNALKAEYYITPEEYLAGERISQQKHEYLAGAVYAMSGATLGHDRIANNICRDLGNQLSNKPCEVFSSNVKVRIRRDTAEFYYYPDVTVDCSNSPDPGLYAQQPRVIFEVMSASTGRTDRTEKLHNYQNLASLDVYVLVDQLQVAITIYRRTPDAWEREFLTELDDIIELPTIECELTLRTIYQRTALS